jgi:hypothetical protein
MRNSLPYKKFQPPLRVSDGQTKMPDRKNITGINDTYWKAA